MKVFSGFHHLARCAFFLLLAAPAFAQFEVSPDHFDGPPPVKKTASTQKHNAQNNSTHQTTAKAGNSKMQPPVNIHAGKPSPRKKSASTVATTATGTHKARPRPESATHPLASAPSLKAQASSVHRE